MKLSEETLNRHLGRDADGTLRPVYVTPDKIDPTLLVPVPRSINRDKYGITATDFVGYDRWNCYEFSTLLENNLPLFGSVSVVYSSFTPVIVESKSLKLYLNSFNMHRFEVNTVEGLVTAAEATISRDLNAIGLEDVSVRVTLDIEPDIRTRASLFKGSFMSLEKAFLRSRGLFDSAEEPEELLEKTPNRPDRVQRFVCGVRSNCKVTNQPDWGRVYVSILPGGREGLSPASLLRFVAGLRTKNHFHEEVCEIIYKHVWDSVQPVALLVGCNYMRRGGIDINPIRSSSYTLLDSETRSPHTFNIAPDLRQ